MQKPLISVIIPCYNVQRTIVETLQSILKQTYPNIEIIAVNDGSTDNTAEQIKQLQIDHANVRLYSQENRGLPATRNAGFLKSQGEFIVFLDGDDLLHETYIERCHNEFERKRSVDLVYTDTMLFEAENGLYDLSDFSFETLLGRNCIPSTAMLRRSHFIQAGMYDVALKFTEDWELWIRYTYKFRQVIKIDEPLFFYRKRHSKDSMTDLNTTENVSDKALLYIYTKHYAIYKEYGYGIHNILQPDRYRQKYYNVWYRKLFYRLIKPKKNKTIY